MRGVFATLVTTLLLSGCSGSATEPATVTVSPSGPSGASADMSSSGVKESAKAFLNAVCPTDSALQAISETALAAGGWLQVAPGSIHDLADWAIQQVRGTSQTLDGTIWPGDLAAKMPEVSREHLAMLRPLATLGETNSGDQMRRAWQYLNEMSRTSEESVRIDLRLGAVNSEKDGCPPPKMAEARPQKTPSGSDSAAGSWTQYWQSPSGNIRCGFTPDGSAGVPTVACLVADQNTLARLPQGGQASYSPSATESQRAQLPGGPVLGYGSFLDVGPFQCWQSPPDGIGMTCTDMATQHGFSIKRDSFVPF